MPAPPPAVSAAPAPAAQGAQPAPELAPAEPGRAAQDDFTTVEDAEKALAQAQSELERVAVLGPRPATGRGEAAHGADKKAAARSAAPAAAGADLGAPSGEGASGGSACDNVCRAYSSLLRAANAVCRIDGDSGAHCAHAKQVRSDAERRVSSCSCPS
jgi:hypothetical protein